MNSVRSNNISLKYQRFTTLGSKAIGIIKFRVCGKDSIPLPITSNKQKPIICALYSDTLKVNLVN